ncbi:glycosyltransferase family 4 protein [Aquabacterium sp.]|uniref:glycosyltransferase family 4 protein n=1 Tax=Aquabacterium sp. TaxID=1872578 RepID=UPI003783F0DD
MKVVFDHQIFSVQAYGGFSKYFVSLARALRALPGVEADIVAPAHVNEYLGPADAHNPLTFKMAGPRRGLRYRPRLLAPLFRLVAGAQRPDVIHETHYLLGGGHLPRGVPVMATCHDMIIEQQDDGSPRSREAIAHKRLAFERAGGIICISEHTRAELLQRYPQLEAKVSVIHHGVEAVPAPATVDPPLPSAYLLFVGLRGGYKNFGTLLRAFGASPRLHREFQLLCFGGGPLTPAELQACAEAGIPAGRVQQRSGDEFLLAYAYRHAALLVCPSLHEGFGMPLTEAMVQGCAVACSDASCFPEICADAAAYFDPLDADAMRSTIERLLDDSAYRDAMRLRGRARAAAFSWPRCADRTAAAYARLQEHRP